MNNWNIYGHDWAVEMLQRHVVQGSLRHAYLITGPDGVGRRTLALRLVQALNCPNPTAPGVPCRTCRTCVQIEQEKFFDMTVVKRLGGKKDLIIDQIRVATRFLSTKPYMSQYKIGLFLDFNEANDNASNAILKTLEEAPSYAVLLLTAENTEQLLPTLVSRCEILRLRPLKIEIMEDFLSTLEMPVQRSQLLSHLADGCPGYAVQLNDAESDFLTFRAEKLAELRQLLSENLRERFKYAQELATEDTKARDAAKKKTGKLQKPAAGAKTTAAEIENDEDEEQEEGILLRTFLIWLSFWRDVLLKIAGAQMEVTNIDQVEFINELSWRLDRSQTLAISLGIEKAIGQLGRNVNRKMLLEVTLMDWPRVR